jgi:hypothetical protein
METYVRVRKYGTLHNGKNVGYVPHKLEEFIEAIQEARLEIPAQHRASATVSLEPDYELGEHYSSLEIGYYREMTDAEGVKHRLEERHHWEEQLQEAEASAIRCREELAALSKAE